MVGEWLAGFIEGEGSFTFSGSNLANVAISIANTDEDVMQRAARELESNLMGPYKYPRHKKQYWQVCVRGPRALQYMIDMYPQMGQRRQKRILDLLEWWEHGSTGYIEKAPRTRK